MDAESVSVDLFKTLMFSHKTTALEESKVRVLC